MMPRASLQPTMPSCLPDIAARSIARVGGDEILARALAAETELSTLRARVREVVGPFAALEATGWTGSYLSEPGHDGSDVSVLHHAASNTTVTRGHFRAARQLMEDLK